MTVWEFLAVQLDMSQYRSSWDTSTAQCHQVETEDTAATETGDYWTFVKIKEEENIMATFKLQELTLQSVLL